MRISALACAAVCKMPCCTLLCRPVALLEKNMPCFTSLYKFAASAKHWLTHREGAY